MTAVDPSGPVDGPIGLRCSDAIDLVTHYLDDALDADDLARFEQHVAGCEGCAVFVDQVRMTIRLVGQAGGDEVELLPRNFDALVEMLIERSAHGPSPGSGQ
ncbi:MAG: zf-HC2 domain-containing protein [Acidimicrobiales bacterium]